jgi:hypothetical protein
MLARERDFSLFKSIQIGSGGYPTSYTMSIKDSFPGDKATVA